MSDNGIGIAVPTLPKGGGAIRGIGETFQPNPFTGAGTLSIPIKTSPCRGFAPALSVEYSSGSGNGHFGLGFGMAIPNVSRKTEKGIPHYDERDTFILSNADDLVQALVMHNGVWQPDQATTNTTPGDTSTTHIRRFRPRTEGLFARIEHRTSASDGDNYWVVISKENVTNVYGLSDNARVADPADPSHVYQWLLEESWDAHGNRVRYEYRPENNGALSRIRYGNHRKGAGSWLWHFEVIFDYGERALDDLENLAYAPTQAYTPRKDPFSSYRAGFEIRNEHLCRAILMFHRFEGEFDGEPFAVHCTRFDYDETPYLSQLTEITQIGLRKESGGYAYKAMPPLTLHYSKPRALDGAAIDGTPLAVAQDDGKSDRLLQQPIHEFADLYGDGLPGLLYSDDQTTLYWRALGDGRYAAPSPAAYFPAARDLRSGRFTLADIGGDGKLDLVVHSPAVNGFFQSQPDGHWDAYRSFAASPLESFTAHRQMADLTGDGLADLVLFESSAVKVYPSQGKLGYAPAISCPRPHGLPMTSNPSRAEVVRIADMFGDGGSHITHIRNGAITCWPHLGYGQYGAPVELTHAPEFGDDFDGDRLFLADLDGSGTLDVIYAHHDHLDIYRNQSGNGFGPREVFPLSHGYDTLTRVRFADVLGNGTASLVVTTHDPDLALRHQYVDFSGGIKPHLLTTIDNNMGLVKQIGYAPSTRFFLADQKAGTPWRTRLAFPVQVVESIELCDQIAKTRRVTRFAYHDGYFDPIEREFRGFGHVEQWDAESFDVHSMQPANEPANADHAAYVAPLYTRIWYHNGAQPNGTWANENRLSGHYKDDYDRGDVLAHHLPDSVPERRILGMLNVGDAALFTASPLPKPLSAAQESLLAAYGIGAASAAGASVLTVQQTAEGTWRVENADQRWALGITREEDCLVITDESWPMQPAGDLHEAYRALHGHELRREVYGDDAAQYPDCAPHPYIVTESNFTVRLLQPKLAQPHAVCLPHPWQKITYHYERDPHDPRVEHEFTIEVDAYGETVKSCVVAYPRRNPRAHEEQRKPSAVATVSRFAHLAGGSATADEYLVGVPIEKQSFELGGLTQLLAVDNACYLSAERLARHLRIALTQPINHEEALDDNQPAARRLSWERHLYWDADQVGALPLGRITGRELHHHSEEAVFSVAQVAAVFQERVDEQMLCDGGYHCADGHWWRPGATQHYAKESAYFVPVKTVDVFGATSRVEYDAYHLLPLATVDAMENVTHVEIDYHTLQPWRVTDTNENHEEVLFDALGMVIATSRYGTEEGVPVGDAPLTAYSGVNGATGTTVLARVAHFLDQATTAFFYDLHAWQARNTPPHAISLKRETPISKLSTHSNGRVIPSRCQVQITYVDGSGRNVQTKVKAGDKGWLTLGGTLYNNKGHPVKEFEPTYRPTPDYEGSAEVTRQGVTHVTHYDPLGRVVRVDAPDGTFTKVDFGPWEEVHFDANDTVLDASVTARSEDDPVPEGDHADARAKAAANADTPKVRLLDSLGHVFLIKETLAGQRNGLTERADDRARDAIELATYHSVDVQGHERFSIDPRLYAATGTARRNFEYRHAMNGVVLKTVSADAGTHWALHNAHGSLIHIWDSRGFHTTTSYDLLQRPIDVYVEGDDGDGLVLKQFVERLRYVDGADGSLEAAEFNLRGRLVEHYDQAGCVRVESYSHHGLPLRTTRQLRTVYQHEADWSVDDAEQWNAELDDESFITRTEHDALGRVTRIVQPFGDLLEHAYHAEGWVSRLRLQRAAQPEHRRGEPHESEAEISVRLDYDAKGRRTRVRYGDNVTTTYDYDVLTHRLAQLTTRRTSDAGVLQALTYAYDPVGNITRIRNGAQETVVTHQAVVDGVSDYTYDSLDRLVRALGREHLVLSGARGLGPTRDTIAAPPQLSLNDLEQLRPYQETYSYDHAGNRIALRHAGERGWTQSMSIAADSNRTESLDAAGDGTPTPMHYDAHGNLRGWDAGPDFHWNVRDNLAAVDLVLRTERPFDDREYYVYASGGRRVRKVTETLKSASERGLLIEINETIYLGALDIHRTRREVRRYDVQGEIAGITNAVRTGERQSVYLMDDNRRAGVFHRRPVDADTEPVKTAQVRYQLDDHLGSVALELTGDGRRISYEEYYPFGGTALIAGRGRTDVVRKTYRYSGKERDDSTGLYYYGVRYYATWLGRWLSPDPVGTVDGLNLYAFVSGNPIRFVDEAGFSRVVPLTVFEQPASYTTANNAMKLATSKIPSLVNAVLKMWPKFLKGPSSDSRLQSKALRDPIRETLREMQEEDPAYHNSMRTAAGLASTATALTAASVGAASSGYGAAASPALSAAAGAARAGAGTAELQASAHLAQRPESATRRGRNLAIYHEVHGARNVTVGTAASTGVPLAGTAAGLAFDAVTSEVHEHATTQFVRGVQAKKLSNLAPRARTAPSELRTSTPASSRSQHHPHGENANVHVHRRNGPRNRT